MIINNLTSKMTNFNLNNNLNVDNEFNINEIDNDEINFLDININYNNLKNQFEGMLNPFLNWIPCEYCIKYHPKSMYLTSSNYCAHCWGWLNEQQIDLINLKYTGNNSIAEIKAFLKLTYPLHIDNCNLQECIYNKITNLFNENKLNKELAKAIGLVKETEKNKKIKINKNIHLNYKLSNIMI